MIPHTPFLAATADGSSESVTIAVPLLLIVGIFVLIRYHGHRFGAAFLAFVLGVVTAGAVVSATIAHSVLTAIASIVHSL